MTGHVQTSSEATGSCSPPPLIIIRDPHSPLSFGCYSIYIYIVFITKDVCELYFITSPLGLAVGPRSVSGEIFSHFK